jgi:hypothetical protein
VRFENFLLSFDPEMKFGEDPDLSWNLIYLPVITDR